MAPRPNRCRGDLDMRQRLLNLVTSGAVPNPFHASAVSRRRVNRRTLIRFLVSREIFSTGTAINGVFLPDVRTRVAAAAWSSPQRSGLFISGGRRTRTASGRGEPHPTLMRTPAAQPQKAERLCQGTCPGPSRYAYVPRNAAIHKATGSLLERERPVRHGWRPGRIIRAKTPEIDKPRSGGSREDVGWPLAKPVTL